MVELRTFTGGVSGEWEVTGCEPVVGDGLAAPPRLGVRRAPIASIASTAPAAPGPPAAEDGAWWSLRGTESNLRYTTAAERDALRAVSPPLGRPEATRAALVPIRMSPTWWALAQDERRAVLEERSHHIAIGLAYLPAVARELSHGRDLGEPFDFLTWFEYAPADAAAFEELVARLRATPEWDHVDREVDLRLARPAGRPR